MPKANPANVYYELVVEFEPWVDPETALTAQLDEVTEIIHCTPSQPNIFEIGVWIDTPLYPGEHGEFDWRAVGYAKPMLNDIQGIVELKKIRADYHIAMAGDDIIPDDILVDSVIEERERKIEQRLI